RFGDYSEGGEHAGMVRGPQPWRNDAVGRILADDVHADGCESVAVKYEIDPPVERGRKVQEVFCLGRGETVSDTLFQPSIVEARGQHVCICRGAAAVRVRIEVTQHDFTKRHAAERSDQLIALCDLYRAYVRLEMRRCDTNLSA